MNIPADLHYTKDHEWVRFLPDGSAVVGITDFAQNSLGDVVFVELPRVGDSFAAHAKFGTVESVKAASDLYLPVAGTVLEVNEGLVRAPEKVNRDPYGEAWMVKLQPAATEHPGLLDAVAYAALTAA